jgi:3-hydroxyacyl-CoA dehydrogenase, NAD binding domain
MPFDPKAADLLAVVGTASMRRGIMQVAAQGGMRVLAFDAKPEAAKAAVAHIATMIETQIEKGRLAAGAGQAALDRNGLAHNLAALAEVNVIIEAIVEWLDVKQALFARLDAMTGPDTIVASNTSSLPSTAIASACQCAPSACAACNSGCGAAPRSACRSPRPRERLKPAKQRLSANGSASAKAFGSRSPATPHRAQRTRWH